MKSIIWLVTPIILLLVLIIILIPKNTSTYVNGELTKECDCYGSLFWYKSKCIGFTHNCSNKEPVKTSCQTLTCGEIIENYILASSNKSKVTTNLLQSDIVVMIDVSNSMVGAKLQAAKDAGISLINNVREKDRVGVITFSETAIMVSEFSNNTHNLSSKIENISVRGGTKYLPALLLAEEMFKNSSSENVVRGIIFLSDGIPSDETITILAKSAELTQQNISLFTISFGIEGNNILQDMTGGSNILREKRYRSFTTTESITEAFVEAYKELTTINAISIEQDFSQDTFTIQELEKITFSTYINNTFITAIPSENVCFEGLTTEMYATNTNTTSAIALEAYEKGFRFPPGSLVPGTYSFNIHSQFTVEGEEECTFIGESTLNNLHIISHDPCQPPSCEEIQTILINDELTYTQALRYPRNITQSHIALFIDSSESMKTQLSQALSYAQLIDNALYSSDYRSLTIFSQEAVLKQEFTREKIFPSEITIEPKGTTQLLPALKKTRNMFKTIQGKKGVIIITDGEYNDQVNEQTYEKEITQLASQGVCTYFIGVGTQVLRDEELLQNLGNQARKEGCGGYIHSPSEKEVLNILEELFEGNTQQNGLLFIDSKINNEKNLELYLAARQTGIALPIRTDKYCVEAPQVNFTLSTDNKVLVQEELSPNYYGKYDYHMPQLPPGKHQLTFSTLLSNCSEESATQEIIVEGKSKEQSGPITALAILITIGMIITFAEFLKN